MFFIILGVLFISLLVVIKIVKGVFKLVLILVVVGLLIATFAGKDDIESVPVAPSTAT